MSARADIDDQTLHSAVDDRPRSRDGAWPIALVAVLVAATALRFVGLGDIERKYFDEKYYVTQAQERIDGLEPVDRPAHPPLGTWLIAGGIAALGDEPVGWRVAPAVAGVTSVLLAYAVAARAFGRRWIGVLAALFVTLDGLAIVTSRVAILDGLQVPFALGAVYAALRWRADRATAWLVVAGVCAGAMTAIKWNGVLLLGAILLWLGVVLVARSRADALPAVRAVIRLLSALAVVAGVAALVYVASYATWFADYPDTETATDRCEDQGECGTGATDRVRSWWWEQLELVDYHDRLEATHPDRSSALEWPLLSDPVTVFLERCGADSHDCAVAPGHARRILAVGNPALWWPAFLSLPVLGTVAWRRRRPDVALVALVPSALWLTWLASPKPGFIYFLTPVVPFLAVALAGAIGLLPSRRWRTAVGAVVVSCVLAAAVWHAPLYFGWSLDEAGIAARNLFPSWPD